MYQMQHRPGNPLEYPEEIATLDKILSGDYFPDDILKSANKYFSDYNDYDNTKEMIDIMLRAQNNPDMIVTIYRGAPSEGILNTGDWVTLNRDYALAFAGDGIYSDNPDSKVYEYKVKASELSFDGDSIYEFGYWGKMLEAELEEELEEEFEL